MRTEMLALVPASDPIGTDNLSAMAFERVRDMIRTRQLRGGEMIVEARLAESLGISRTPLREALQKLEGEGLVVKASGRSFLVRRVDLAEYLQSVRVREILEPEAAAMATGRIPSSRIAAVKKEMLGLYPIISHQYYRYWCSGDNIHNLLVEFCGSDVLGHIIKGLRVTTRLFETSRLDDRLELDAVEHEAIIQALEMEDPKLARKAVQNHIRSLSRFAIDTVR